MPVPSELLEYKQWVLWRRAEVNGRIAKLPISPWSGKVASCDKPQTWSTYKHVCYAHRKFRCDGIGFVFTTNDPFCGIDLDQCRALILDQARCDGEVDSIHTEAGETHFIVCPCCGGECFIASKSLAGGGKQFCAECRGEGCAEPKARLPRALGQLAPHVRPLWRGGPASASSC